MKTKIALLSVLIFIAALWACWSMAYTRGYRQGAHDEFSCWKQEPMVISANWDGKVMGRRDLHFLPGGQRTPEPAIRVHNEPANNIPSIVFPR